METLDINLCYQLCLSGWLVIAYLSFLFFLPFVLFLFSFVCFFYQFNWSYCFFLCLSSVCLSLCLSLLYFALWLLVCLSCSLSLSGSSSSSSRSSDGNSSLPDEGGSASQVPQASVQLAGYGSGDSTGRTPSRLDLKFSIHVTWLRCTSIVRHWLSASGFGVGFLVRVSLS